MGIPTYIIDNGNLRDYDKVKDNDGEGDANFGQMSIIASNDLLANSTYNLLMENFTSKLECYYEIRANDNPEADCNLEMARNGKHSAESQTGFQVGAGDLEGLVFISGPCSGLPNRCSRRRIPNGVVYRPEVEVRDGSERLYSKYNLALFEVLDKEPSGATLGVEEHDEGPAAAVLRRRRRRQQQSNEGSAEQRVAKTVASKREAADEVEDTSDEHYRKLHRKPEYMERRIRNREIELYQYAQWQEGQRMGSERWRQLNGSHQHLAIHQQLGHVGGGSEAGGSDATGATQPQSQCASPLPPSAKPNTNNRVADAGATKVEEADLGDGTAMINETLRRLDDMRTSDTTTRKRFKSGMRNELKALLDSSGYQDARARSVVTNNNNEDNTGSGNDASRAVAKESPSPPPPPAAAVIASASNAVSNTSIVSVDVASASGESVQQQQQQPLSEAERRVAHLGGTILEQLLIQAARLPPLAEEEASDDGEESEDEASDKASDEEDEASEEASDEANDSESQSGNGSGSDDSQEGDADNASESPEAEDEEDAGDSCCCPREFELPQRLFGHMTKQREQQRL
ncbi:hypothetical protein GGH93_001156 [Coemansia aciculifera]|nr:hypothetical protein GGH93_001156 [Coemansia aciculifera]